jgi:hypothetical protein
MLLWWLDGEATRFVSHDKLKSIYATHFKGSDLARLPPTAVTSGRIEAFLLPKEKKYSATYVNHMRRLVHRVFAAAIRVEEWGEPGRARPPATRAEAHAVFPRSARGRCDPSGDQAVLAAALRDGHLRGSAQGRAGRSRKGRR